MIEEFAYKDESGRWIGGYPTRKAAMHAGSERSGRKQVVTAPIDPESPSYFARFEARAVLSAMISGLERGVELGKVVEVESAVARLQTVLSASPLDAKDEPNSALHLDLMNRLQAAVEAWLSENRVEFSPPKIVRYMAEELHLVGTNLDIPLP